MSEELRCLAVVVPEKVVREGEWKMRKKGEQRKCKR